MFYQNQKEKGKNSKDDDDGDDDDGDDDEADELSVQDKCDKATAAAKTK